MNWHLDSPMRPLFAGSFLFVGDWHCPGEVRPWMREHARYHQIELRRQGTQLRRSASRRCLLDPTLAAFDDADDEYTLASPTPYPQRSTILLVAPELASELEWRLSSKVHPVSTGTAILHHWLLSTDDALAFEERALTLVHRLVADARATVERPAAPSASWRRLAEDAQHVIATRYQDPLTIEAIAAACRKSPFHLSRVFRAVTGQTVHRYLTNVRLRVALLDFRRSTGRLGEIALRVGFSSHSHFAHAFRSEFGVPPSMLLAK